MDNLVQAIDRAMAYVREHLNHMTRDEMDEFHRLAEAAYVLAFRQGLVGALPQMPELRPQIESLDPPLPPVQFESKLNLPGDWDFIPALDADGLPVGGAPYGGQSKETGQRAFLVCASPRWFQDMNALRKLAESQSGEHGEDVPSARRWNVDLAGKQLTIDNMVYDVSSERALRWVKVLLEHEGDWISSSELEKLDPDLMSHRTDKLKHYLPSEIRNLIESQTGAGSRIRLGRK